MVAEAQHSVVCGKFVSTLALVEFRTRDVIELKLFAIVLFVEDGQNSTSCFDQLCKEESKLN